MYAAPTIARNKATLRLVLASFAAGAFAMGIVAIVPVVAAKGALSVRSAEADTRVMQEQLIEPLNVAAIRAQLDAAEGVMASARATTDDDIARLARLTR